MPKKEPQRSRKRVPEMTPERACKRKLCAADLNIAASSIQTQKLPTSLSGGFFNTRKDETPDIAVGGLQEKSGGVLLSHKVSLAVPLALASLTSEFEMGSGVTSPL